jgi:hypothetical protein
MSDDLREFFRKCQRWAPGLGLAAYLVGLLAALVLPLGVEPLALGVACGMAFMIAGGAYMGYRAIDDANRQQQSREDEEWCRAVNAGVRDPDAKSESN